MFESILAAEGPDVDDFAAELKKGGRADGRVWRVVVVCVVLGRFSVVFSVV